MTHLDTGGLGRLHLAVPRLKPRSDTAPADGYGYGPGTDTADAYAWKCMAADGVGTALTDLGHGSDLLAIRLVMVSTYWP